MLKNDANDTTTQYVEVVKIDPKPLPNSDRLSLAMVYGYPCVTNTEQWAGRQLAAYVPPDSLVPISRPEFSFLAPRANLEGYARIKAMKLRGQVSFGLLVPAPDGAEEGDYVDEILGVKHYEPGKPKSKGGIIYSTGSAAPPNVVSIKYDLEHGRRYAEKVFRKGEPVYVTEKIHGCLARFVYDQDKMNCGSKSEWKREYEDFSHVTMEYLAERGCSEERVKDILARIESKQKEKSDWWKLLDIYPQIFNFCHDFPGFTLWGEMYGRVQDLKYGTEPGEIRFVGFDVMRRDGTFLDGPFTLGMMSNYAVPSVPLINRHFSDSHSDYGVLVRPIPYDFHEICGMAEGKTLMPDADHVREGVVVKPMKERSNERGRACLKFVGQGYYDRKGIDVEPEFCEE